MVWLTLLAWGLHQEFKKDLLTEEMAKDGSGPNLDKDFYFDETTSVEEGLKDARSRAVVAEKRALEAEGRELALQKVELRTQDFN